MAKTTNRPNYIAYKEGALDWLRVLFASNGGSYKKLAILLNKKNPRPSKPWGPEYMQQVLSGKLGISRYLIKAIKKTIAGPGGSRKFYSIWAGNLRKWERDFIYKHLSPEERRRVLLKAAKQKGTNGR